MPNSSKEPARAPGVDQRLNFFALTLCLAFALLCWQFWQLQVVERHLFEQRAEENTVRESTIKGDRGIIYGRDGVVLADNRPAADILFVPGDCPEEERRAVCERLENLLGISADTLYETIRRYRWEPFTQIPVKRDVSKAERIRVEERAFQLPGVVTVVHPQRRYPHGRIGGQLLGYVNEINRQELDTWEGNYMLGDLVGRGGVESYYEHLLKGEPGFMLITKYASGMPQLRTNRWGVPIVAERDSIGHLLDRAESKRPVAGASVYLSLDVSLQAKCEALLGTEVGAIVVLEAETGAIRALASTPTYDPSVFVSGRSEEKLALYEAKEPMLARAYREVYPPGSIYKLVVAAAGLEEGVINEHSSFFCRGSFRLPNYGRPWGCHSIHGSVALLEALAYSCDVYFYNVGLKLGPDKMAEWAHRMGTGIRTGIDLPGEAEGLIPTRAWFEEHNRDKPAWDRRWTDGLTLNASIGQGQVTNTPLQSAVMMATIANGGRLVRPYLNVELGPEVSEPFLSQKTVDLIGKGLQMCVEKRTGRLGTGRAAYLEDFTILGKTGTAQIVSLSARQAYSKANMPRHLRHHAWFVAAVVDRDPKIAICILIEHGEGGGSTAAPLTRDIVRHFYALEDERQEEPRSQPVTLAQEGGR